MKYISDTIEYKSYKYIRNIPKLQRKVRAKPISKLLSNLRDPKMSYFSVNSTTLWTKQEINERMRNLVCFFI